MNEIGNFGILWESNDDANTIFLFKIDEIRMIFKFDKTIKIKFVNDKLFCFDYKDYLERNKNYNELLNIIKRHINTLDNMLSYTPDGIKSGEKIEKLKENFNKLAKQNE